MSRNTLQWTLKLAVSTALLALLFWQTDAERLWQQVRQASPMWLGVALSLYFLMILVSAWRWGYLLSAQHVRVPLRTLVDSYLVATFFNNFLPSNIGGDVIRIRDTVEGTGSKTVATLIVVIDRAVGLVGLLIVAAVAASVSPAGTGPGQAQPVHPAVLWAGLGVALGGVAFSMLSPSTVTRLLRPLRRIHREWVDERLTRMLGALTRLRDQPSALINCLAGAVVVQLVLVAFYAAIAHSLRIPIGWAHLAVIVPMSFVVQMLPVSVNGLGIREATFSYYFLRLRLPIEAALVLSLLGAGLTLLFSISGAIVYASRR
jgi:uncharacterized membrane protein YbhN (UPF0104 family)